MDKVFIYDIGLNTRVGTKNDVYQIDCKLIWSEESEVLITIKTLKLVKNYLQEVGIIIPIQSSITFCIVYLPLFWKIFLPFNILSNQFIHIGHYCLRFFSFTQVLVVLVLKILNHHIEFYILIPLIKSSRDEVLVSQK